MNPKYPRCHFIVSYCFFRRYCISSAVVGKPVIYSLKVLHKSSYVCALIDDPCTKIYLLKMNFFECPNLFDSFSAVTGHGLARQISMHTTKRCYRNTVVEKINNLQNDTSRDEFNSVSRKFFGYTKWIKVNRAAFTKIDTNIIGSNFAVEENVCVD